MEQTLLYSSLVLILILFVIQAIVLHKRGRQIHSMLKHIQEMDKEAALGRVLVGVAHDLKTPLGALGCAMHTRRQALDKLGRILADEGGSAADPTGTGKAVKALESTDLVVSESLKRSLDMVQKLSKAGRGEPEEPVLLPAREVLESVLRILDYRFKDKISVVNELDAAVLVKVQPGGLGRVFANLLVNAADALEDEGEIRITQVEADGKTRIVIADNGPGLPSGKENELFSSGWTTKCSEEGSGLGLFISREIMRGFEGDLEAGRSAAGGAAMTLVFPAASANSGETS